MSKKRLKKLGSLLTLLLSLAIIIFLYPKLRDPQVLKHALANWGWKAIPVDLLILSLQMLFPVIPFALLAGINILLFGWLAGFFISLTGSVLGSCLGFWIARLLGQDWVQSKLDQRGKDLSDKIKNNGFFWVFLARLIPILPAAAVNYSAGLSPIKFRSFFLATLLGKIPIITWESWIGHDFWQLRQHPERFLLALILGSLIFCLTALAWHFSSRRENKN